ncbi:phage integrase SAM-like domain-containing protein [Cobetia sp.]|uniref:phage integrase SAM-like domain-containing protein n=1 Tax=Cobetia sp. TaxID=1873876 RepID=UPI00257BE26F|nr:phage integrase SAM-like domain-containing protein [Cobetia sp.]
MTSEKYISIQALHAMERRIQRDLSFTATCKNTNKKKVFDFSKKKYARSNRKIMEVFVWAIYKLRHKSGNSTKVAYYEKCNSFFEFLEQHSIYEPEAIETDTFSRYIEWLKRHPQMSYPTAASVYRSLRVIFDYMGNHPKINKDIRPPRNAFPKSTSLQKVDVGYDDIEFKKILKSIIQSLRDSRQRFETEHDFKYLGLEEPLEGVATLHVPTGKYVTWATHEHRVWFFENAMKCQKLSTYSAIAKIPKGHVFWYSFIRDYPHPKYKNIREFYEYIGAGPNYQPKYIDQPSPVKYRSPWQKWEYVVWYWENKMGAHNYTDQELNDKFPEFRIAMKEYWSSAKKAMEQLNVWRWISSYDLAPYYFMLIIRTGLNPSTIQRLDINCIVKDPIDPELKYINWTKYRANKKGRTISEGKAMNDTWAISIIERVIKITAKIRPKGMDELWISDGNNQKIPKPFTAGYFEAGVRKIFEKYPVFSSESGEKIKVYAKNIRPTIAWNEYLRTEDLRYLQTLLGHTKTSTTSEYLRRLNDPLFRVRRAIHSEAMFIGLTDSDDVAKKALIGNRLGVIAKDEANGIFDGLLNHCKDPANSPVTGQHKGDFCSASTDVCLGCQNLVITPRDIKKHFCYINFHDYLLTIGEISTQEYEKSVSDKIYFWDEYILKKYPETLVRDLKEEARTSPIPVWDPKRYEDEK